LPNGPGRPNTDVKGLLPVVNNQRVIHKDRSSRSDKEKGDQRRSPFSLWRVSLVVGVTSVYRG
jgi:hypothetical protein